MRFKFPEETFPNRPKQSFGIRHAGTLFFKLATEVYQFKKSYSNAFARPSYLAINIAMTAWHLIEWTYADMNKSQKELAGEIFDCQITEKNDLVKAVLNDCPEMIICKTIANASKHVEVTRKPEPSLRTSHEFEIIKDGLPADIEIHTNLIIEFRGQKYPAEEVFIKVKTYWQNLLERLFILESQYRMKWSSKRVSVKKFCAFLSMINGRVKITYPDFSELHIIENEIQCAEWKAKNSLEYYIENQLDNNNSIPEPLNLAEIINRLESITEKVVTIWIAVDVPQDL